MLHVTLRNLMAHKVRLVMSGLAVILGIAFLAGVLTFNNGLRSTFNGIINGSTPDALVRAEGTLSFDSTVTGTASTISPADVAKLGQLPQVAKAEGSVDGFGMFLLDKKGLLVGGTGAPTLAFNYGSVPNMNGDPMMVLDAGDWPTGPHDIFLDTGSAKSAGYHLGDTVTVIPPSADANASSLTRQFTLVGTGAFNGGGTAGATLILFQTRTAQELFLGGKDAFTSVALSAADGVSQQELVDAADTVVPKGYTAVTGDKVVKESQDAIGTALGFMSAFLITFAVIAVIVSAFIIFNTFSILVAQRVRELALLRALGASRRQVTASVLIEALVMSLVGSTLGVLLGIGLARGLAALLSAVGIQVNGDQLHLSAGTLVAAYAVGIVVTVVSAFVPARRAATIAPVAAMRDDVSFGHGPMHRRTIICTAMLLLGAALAVVGLVGGPGNDALYIGGAALLWVLAAAGISPVLGHPVLAFCRALFRRLFGAAGRLAGENALRNPRRTGATASALMIGLALVSAVGVLATSMGKTTDKIVADRFSTDFVVQAANYSAFPTAIGDQMAKVPGVERVYRMQVSPAEVEKKQEYIYGVDPGFADLYRLDLVSGSAEPTGHQTIANVKTAKKYDLSVGDSVTMAFPGGKKIPITLVGIYADSQVADGFNMPLSVLTDAGLNRSDTILSIDISSGADAGTVQRDLEKVIDGLPIVSVQDGTQFADSLKGQVNQLLYLIYALLALAVVIAVLGIINTLGLSVVERTREIGLLRAIGMTRARLRRMITLESVAIAVLGAILGMGLGLLIGVLLRQSLSKNLTELGIPWVSLVIFLVISVLFGVIAAVIPSIRASRLKVLSAIASE